MIRFRPNKILSPVPWKFRDPDERPHGWADDPHLSISQMSPNFLYLARSQTDPTMRKHNVYKVGHSKEPMERIRKLAGSASTETFEPILIVALPNYVKDAHVLSHRDIQPFVVHRQHELQAKYITVFGKGHREGLTRRRELVMFGPRFALSRIKALFRRVVDSISSHAGTYVCTDRACAGTGGTAYCEVCTKFTQSLLNSATYHNKRLHKRSSRRNRRNILASVQNQLQTLMPSVRKRKQWQGPALGSFWMLRPDPDLRQLGYRFLIVRVLSNDNTHRKSQVQGWAHSGTDTASLVRTLQSKFTEDSPMCSVEDIRWDQQSVWECLVHMKQFKSFCRVLNVSDVVRACHWTVAAV